MARDEFPWGAVIAGAVGLGVGVVLGKSMTAGAATRPAGQTATSGGSAGLSFEFGEPAFDPTKFIQWAQIDCSTWMSMKSVERDSLLRYYYVAVAGSQARVLLSTNYMQAAVDKHCMMNQLQLRGRVPVKAHRMGY